MKILKLPWFGHRTDNKKIECYSVTINSDGTRLASGGLDGNVKIWDTKTILEFNKLADVKDKAAEPDCVLPDPSLRRPLCSMSRHNGVVTTVKFSPDGRFLASGSDDKICLIWEKDDESVNRPKQFGESEADLEHWNIRKRLVAHDNDIQDIAWSPDGLLLVTVGLDRSIIIWNALSFERIKRYDVHQSMVKGIVFDPANKFFATASDDRTVRIFRYYKKLNDYNNYEFQVEHIVIDPFKKSPLTSYFRRMSWSPDGQHIAVPNATNGPVSSVVIINRGNWTTDISLIGHEAPCEVCAFSPRMFDTANSSKDSSGGLSTVLATAGQDRTLAIWRTTSSRPLVLAQDIVDNSITDMCWSPDGQSLFLCCLDGSITVVSFELGELGKMVSEDMINDQLNKYGADRDSNIFPESVGQLILESKSKVETDLKSKEDLKFDQKPLEVALIKSKNEPADILQSRLQSKSQNQPHNNLDEQSDKLSSPNIANLTPQQMTKMVQSVTMKNGKKRVAPLLISSSSSSPFKAPVITTNKVFKNTKISSSNYYLPRLGLTTSVNGLKSRSLHKLNELEPDHDNDNDDMGGNNNPTTQATSQTLSEASLKRQRNKHRRSVLEMRYPSSFKLISDLPETLFYSPAVVNAEANQLLNTISNNTASGTGNASTGIAVNGTVSVSASTSTASSIAPKETTEISNFSNIDTDEDLYFSVIIHGISHTYDSRNKLVNEADDHANRKRQVRTTIEVRNGSRWPTNEDEMVLDDDPSDRLDFNDPTRVIVSTSSESCSRSYSLHFPFKIQHAVGILLKGKLVYYALVSFHGTVQIVHAFSGNYLCPGMELGENVVAIRQSNGFLTMLTNSGQLHSWRLFDGKGKKIVAILKGVSIAPIVNMVEIDTSSQGKKGARSLAYALPNIKSFEVGLDGSPYAVLENTNDIYRYSIDMRCWTKSVDSWYYLSVAPLGSTPTIKLGKVLEQLVYKTYKDFKDDVKRAKINTYDLEDSSLTYLRRNMASRFEETIEAQGGLQD